MKKNKLRNALLKTLFLLFLVGAGLGYFVIWVAKSNDSDFARKAREYIGIREISNEDMAGLSVKPEEVAEIVDPLVVSSGSEAEEVDFTPSITEITYAEIVPRKSLWPEVLKLKLDVEVWIRFNGNNYANMKFSRGLLVQVIELYRNGEILCEIAGNYLSLSIYETDFYGWFNEAYGEIYRLLPVTVEFDKQAATRYSIDTKMGQQEFWAEMREWCYRNYDSPRLSVEQDELVFYWVPKEKVAIDYNGEAREIARQYLIRRAKYGGRENYAACAIFNSQTGEILGTSSLFIPRL